MSGTAQRHKVLSLFVLYGWLASWLRSSLCSTPHPPPSRHWPLITGGGTPERPFWLLLCPAVTPRQGGEPGGSQGALTRRFMYCRPRRVVLIFTAPALAASSSTPLPCVVSKPCRHAGKRGGWGGGSDGKAWVPPVHTHPRNVRSLAGPAGGRPARPAGGRTPAAGGPGRAEQGGGAPSAHGPQKRGAEGGEEEGRRSPAARNPPSLPSSSQQLPEAPTITSSTHKGRVRGPSRCRQGARLTKGMPMAAIIWISSGVMSASKLMPGGPSPAAAAASASASTTCASRQRSAAQHRACSTAVACSSTRAPGTHSRPPAVRMGEPGRQALLPSTISGCDAGLLLPRKRCHAGCQPELLTVPACPPTHLHGQGRRLGEVQLRHPVLALLALRTP